MDIDNEELMDEREIIVPRSLGLEPRGSVTWFIERVNRNYVFNTLCELKNKELDIGMFKEENVRFKLENDRMKILMIKRAQDKADEIIRERSRDG